MTFINYLSEADIILLNKIAITLFDVKKADSHKLLSYSKVMDIVDNCEKQEGNVYDKIVRLIIDIVKKHPFASGNRRTAMLSAFVFANLNKHNIYIPDNPSNSRVLNGIRADYYDDEEIKTWIKFGKIRPFNRFE